jgi:hypothetical protein
LKSNGSNLCLSLADPPVTPSKEYRNLDNFGPKILGPKVQPGLKFYHVQELLVGNYGDPKYYPFRNLRDTKFKEIIERSRKTNCHRGF